jgi:hypothetical protein
MEEIGQVQSDKIREFVVEALDKVPEFYSNINTYIDETKSAIKYASVLLETLDASDLVNDIVKSAILLQDIKRYYEDTDGQGEFFISEDPIHMLSVRQTLLPLLGIVGREDFDDIMKTIESSHGFNSPIPHVVPSMEDPVYIWILPFVNDLARAYKMN